MSHNERPRRARGELRRQQLLDAAVELLLESGIGAATHRAIASRAGVPAASTTYFFPSIDALIAEALSGVLKHELQKLEQLQQRIDSEGLSADAAIDAFVELAMTSSQASIAAQFEMYVAASRRPVLRAQTGQIFDASRTVAANVLERLGFADLAAAEALTAMIDGYALHRLAYPDRVDATLLRQGLQALLAGFQSANR
ncbi:TetR/AcrR family transcriptional regulator [Pseudomonas sp.]|uniref:TetR/AcrR family transcriptional regulator n=1 Tax=Pseudomonas sp. TaxID=306 RepID=UPI003BB5B3BB